MGLARTGIRLFWHVPGDEDALPEPSVEAPPRPFETAAACLLLAYVVAMTVFAAPLMRQTDAIAAQLLAPEQYVNDIRGTTPQVRQP
ncbi:putative monovalent cation/H+ antiporter subunit D [compost metagenome]